MIVPLAQKQINLNVLQTQKTKEDACFNPNPTRTNVAPFVFVIFGETGDLTKNKLIPALLNLFKAGLFNFLLWQSAERNILVYKDLLHACLFGENDSDEAWPCFVERLYYYNLNFN